MATATELFASRVGGVRGAFGAEGVTSTWRVVTTSDDQDPLVQDDVFVAGLPRIGDAYKWTAFGVVCQAYQIVERQTHKAWVIECIYFPPLVLDPATGWDLDISIGTETETVFNAFDADVGNRTGRSNAIRSPIPTEPIGPSEYIQVLLIENGTAIDNEAVAVLAAKYSGMDTSQTYTAGDSGLRFYRLNSRRKEGLNRVKRTGTVTISGQSDTVTDAQVGSLLSLVGTTNADRFLGANIDMLLFLGVQARPRRGTTLGQITNTGFVWDISISMAWNPDRHQPVKVADTVFLPDTGAEVFVADSGGKLVERSYLIYQRRDFTAELHSAIGFGAGGGGK